MDDPVCWHHVRPAAQNRGRLAAALEAALQSLEQGHASAAANQLQVFQRKVEAQLGREEPELAISLIAAAQATLDQLAGD